MNVAIICNSYPTKKNPRNQVFIKKMHDKLTKKKVNVKVCYNKVFEYWGNANKVKNPIANIIKYLFYLYSVSVFWAKNYKKTDILFPQGITIATFIAVIFKKLNGIPVVCYIHGCDLNRYYNKKGIMNSIMRYSLDNSDHVLTNSNDIYEKAKQVTTNPNISIISPGVDLNMMYLVDQTERKGLKKEYKVPDNKIIFMAAGTAIKRKGFDILLDSLLIVDKKVREKIFVLILTDGPEQNNYLDFIRNNNLEETVNIRDRVNHYDLNRYYNIADFFVFPSREEPLGLVGLEAMTSNTIVIGANLGGIKEFVIPNKTGFLFEKENRTELAGIIEHVVLNTNGFDHFYPEIKKMTVKHSLSKSMDELLDLFNKKGSLK